MGWRKVKSVPGWRAPVIRSSLSSFYSADLIEKNSYSPLLNAHFNPAGKMRKLRLCKVSLPDVKQLVQLGSQHFPPGQIYKEKGDEPRACSPHSHLVFNPFSWLQELFFPTKPVFIQSAACTVSSVTKPQDIPESLPGISCLPQLDPNIGLQNPKVSVPTIPSFILSGWEYPLQVRTLFLLNHRTEDPVLSHSKAGAFCSNSATQLESRVLNTASHPFHQAQCKT